MNSLSPDGQTLMSAQSPWGLKYTGGTVFDQSDHSEVGSHAHDDNDDDNNDDDDGSEGRH